MIEVTSSIKSIHAVPSNTMGFGNTLAKLSENCLALKIINAKKHNLDLSSITTGSSKPAIELERGQDGTKSFAIECGLCMRTTVVVVTSIGEDVIAPEPGTKTLGNCLMTMVESEQFSGIGNNVPMAIIQTAR
jgi:hypothetical protein